VGLVISHPAPFLRQRPDTISISGGYAATSHSDAAAQSRAREKDEIGTDYPPQSGSYSDRSCSRSVAAQMNANFTTQPVAATWGTDPEFVDLPGLKRLFGIGRSAAYVLIENGEITSKVLRRKGCIKWKRLIDVASVREFIASQSDEVDPRLSDICRKANRVMREKAKGQEAG
jgi:hypothetical protein